MSERDPEWTDATWLVAGGRDDAVGAPLNVPIVVASTFISDGTSPYARGRGTATWAAFEEVVGGLEGGEAVSFSSGMAAVDAVLSLVASGGILAVPADCYQGVAALAREGSQLGRWTVRYLATDDTDGWIAAAAEADLLWFETPSNPLLVVGDLAAVAAAPRTGLLVVDNTFATPLNQRPLDLGADISMQSATKFLGGHSDLLMGVATTRSPDLVGRLREHQALHGATPGALESYLALRGIRTLPLRLERAEASARELAGRLGEHPSIEVVRYPGFGSMLSFDVVGGGEAADAVCARTRLIRNATSLGGVESMMERRAVIAGQEHLPPGLLRLSVGIEDVEDLWRDLSAAFQFVPGTN
ncbi:MAG TPA: PLP-dependent transferase [Ilumatobacter sp.]|nr:PLP-dependent transferase [Ilumatobacter sp.]